MKIVHDLLIIAQRDLIRTSRHKVQIYGSIARPVIWLFLLGTGLRGGYTQLPPGVNLQQFIFPGMIAMNILFGGIQSGTSIIWDREFGFLKEIMVAPVSRMAIALGKTLSGGVVAWLQGLIVLVLYPVLGFRLSASQLILALAAMFLVAFAVTAIGILIAVRMTSFEGFGTINNFFVMPMFFLSGAMYPTDRIPEWLKYLVGLNPLSFGVDLLRGIILKHEANFSLDIAVLTLFTAIVLSGAIYLFNREGM